MLVETDAGVFYAKLQGDAQAPASLVAGIIVGGLADALGLPVPAPLPDRNAALACASMNRMRSCASWFGRASDGISDSRRLPHARPYTATDALRVNPDNASRMG